jgi:hypothetical protein
VEIKRYWEDIDVRLEKLIETGSVKLPSISQFDLEILVNNISNEMGANTFSELCLSHKLFLEKLGIQEYLAPKLLAIAKNHLGFEGKLSNQYHIARKVAPGNSKEMYRAHFDSHLFTLVLPIQIPTSIAGTAGELIYFPKSRKAPKSEISNFVDKAYHKRFASKDGIKKFAYNHAQMTENFIDFEPLIFIGNTTLHTNKPVSLDCSSFRLTLLAHFFDPSPKYGVGNILRQLRAR